MAARPRPRHPTAPRTLLESFMQSMFEEGVINRQFVYLRALQDAQNPEFVHEVITLFCSDTDKILEEMNRYLSQENFEFHQLDFCIHQLYGSTASIGAHRLKLACDELRQAADDKSKERCLQAINVFTRDYGIFQNKFQILHQIEKGNVYGNGFHETVN